jgi:hypothetical protein
MRILALAALACAAVLAGCSSSHCAGAQPDGGGGGGEIACTTSGGGSLVAPTALGLGASIAVVSVHPCLDRAGGCTATPSFAIREASDAATPRLLVTITLARQPPAATFAVPSADATVAASVEGEGQLQVTGTVDVQSSGPGDLRATFNLEMQAPDGQFITIPSGHVSASGCSAANGC